MVKFLHTINISVFIKPEDDKEKIKSSLLALIPEDEKIKITESSTESFNDRSISIVDVRLDKERHIAEFLKSFTEKLSNDQKAFLLKQDNRLDENLYFFIRLDKQSLSSNELKITDSGERIKLALRSIG